MEYREVLELLQSIKSDPKTLDDILSRIQTAHKEHVEIQRLHIFLRENVDEKITFNMASLLFSRGLRRKP